MTHPTVEVVMVAYESEAFISESIASCALIPGVRIALVDHGTAPSSIAPARQQAEAIGVELRAVHNPLNPGFAEGCNRGARDSSADWLMFLNPDAIINRFDVEALARSGVVGARQVLPDGTVFHTNGVRYRVIDEIRASWFRRLPLPPAGVGYVGGGAMLIERALFEKLGGFDKRFFMFYEDIDLCLRANELGAETYLATDWVVTHQIGHAARRSWSAALQNSYASGRIFHADRYGERKSYDLYVLVDSVARAVITPWRSDKSSAYRQLARTATRNLMRQTPPA
jgi:N-acetylglucosaminyl-diphospho-decaprenol L-rhamnosyltransferase